MSSVDRWVDIFNHFWLLKFLLQVGDSVVESGQWILPGFAEGVYMTEAKDGKIRWEEATM